MDRESQGPRGWVDASWADRLSEALTEVLGSVTSQAARPHAPARTPTAKAPTPRRGEREPPTTRRTTRVLLPYFNLLQEAIGGRETLDEPFFEHTRRLLGRWFDNSLWETNLQETLELLGYEVDIRGGRVVGANRRIGATQTGSRGRPDPEAADPQPPAWLLESGWVPYAPASNATAPAPRSAQDPPAPDPPAAPRATLPVRPPGLSSEQRRALFSRIVAKSIGKHRRLVLSSFVKGMLERARDDEGFVAAREELSQIEREIVEIVVGLGFTIRGSHAVREP